MNKLPFGLLAGSLSWLAACNPQRTQEGARPRPPLDRSAPTAVEVATFALG